MKDEIRAEIDPEDEIEAYRPARKQRSDYWLAYQIAIGIVIGGCVLSALETIGQMIAVKLALNHLQILFGK
jgi:hypothetical protein